MGLSDFPCSCITALLLLDLQYGPYRQLRVRPNIGYPSSCAKSFHTCTGSSTARSLNMPCDNDISGVAFRHFRQRRHSDLLRKNLRGSIPGPHVPLSTLQICRYRHTHMTRGQRGSLNLHCTALASATPCQSPGASERYLTLSFSKVFDEVSRGGKSKGGGGVVKILRKVGVPSFFTLFLIYAYRLML
jgi:hypothetical protein